MASTVLKNKLVKRIQREEDATVLKTIDILLRYDTKEAAMRRRMTETAIRSEEAIKNGEVMTVDEAKKRAKDVLSKLLDRNSSETSHRAMLMEGAERSEADIAAGRVNTITEAKAKARSALRKK